MGNTFRRFSASFALLVLVGCSSGGGGGNQAPPVIPPPVTDPGPPTDEVQFTVLTERTLDADGDMVGLDAYDLIRGFGGDYVPGPIEAPDQYPVNHPEVRHIFEDYDATIGNHFVFIIHRDIDIDRDRLDITDR
mgnify:FL=1